MKTLQLLKLVPLAFMGCTLAFAGPRTDVTVLDDIPADAFLSLGEVWCSEGDTVWLDDVTPVCPDGGTLKLRNIELYSCFTAMDGDSQPEPRLTGTARYTINGNFHLDYTGPVFGKFVMVPGEGCGTGDLVDPDSWWSGTWTGKRTVNCDQQGCMWIGVFKIVGKGHGGEIDGLRFRGQETFTTFTPLPIPWDLIPDFPMTGPEGVVNGVIFE